MRRTTPGVLGAQDLVSPRALRAEEDPERVVRILEPFITDARRQRLREVIGRRLASVAVVLDRPYDPHNGAAVLRSCEAFAVQRLHVVERKGTPLAVAHSVARGAEKWVDVTCHAASAASAIAWARGARLPLVAAHPEGELDPEDLARMPGLALVLGNEREGISEDLAAACEARVKVPMTGFVESLNVSVTAAILLYAATRGRPGDLDEAARLKLYARGLYLSVAHAEEILTLGAAEMRVARALGPT
ncbi:MAG: TrmH family RNA methyltransferase [Polyangiaceae bacterium]|jgi:tRNA (guanosine-2'-O-)-methyltransferase